MGEMISWDANTKHLTGGQDQLVDMLVAVRNSANDCLSELRELEERYRDERADIIERYNMIAAQFTQNHSNANNVTEIIPRVPSGVRQ